MQAGQYQYRTLPQVVAEAATAYGERVAITDGDVLLSYTELNAHRVRAARAFIAAGLEKGDRIAVWAPNIYQWIIAAIGAQSVGGVLVPLNTRLKGAEAAYILQTSGARLLFTVGDFLGVNYPELLRGHELPALDQTVLLSGEVVGTRSWEDFLAGGDAVAETIVGQRAAA
ncbi:MAG: AMP-binding protein, partial [Pseudomonadales bacterium]|nr:AMP-binding protein [Pseudomonadales bacterium]